MTCPTCKQPAASPPVPPVIDRAVLGDPPIKVKPPPQIAGVTGIAATPVTMNEAPRDDGVDWLRLVALPPFQMFAAERVRNTSGGDAIVHATDFIKAQGVGHRVFEDYTQWHAEKGYWPNETPLGEPK